jgi:hypothetical protein
VAAMEAKDNLSDKDLGWGQFLWQKAHLWMFSHRPMDNFGGKAYQK